MRRPWGWPGCLREKSQARLDLPMRNSASVRTPTEEEQDTLADTRWLADQAFIYTHLLNIYCGRQAHRLLRDKDEWCPALVSDELTQGPFSRESHALYSARVAHGGKHHWYAGCFSTIQHLKLYWQILITVPLLFRLLYFLHGWLFLLYSKTSCWWFVTMFSGWWICTNPQRSFQLEISLRDFVGWSKNRCKIMIVYITKISNNRNI